MLRTKFAPGTNILDLQVPPHLDRRILTGLPLIDQAIGGKEEPGTPPTSVVLVTGKPGLGKSTLMAYVADAITGTQNVALYQQGEECVYQQRRNLRRLNLQNGFQPGQERMIDEITKATDTACAANPDKYVFSIVDSLQTADDGKYASGHTNKMSQVRVVQALIAHAEKAGCIYFVVGHVTKAGDFAGNQDIIHEVTTWLHIQRDESKKSETYGAKFLSVMKNRVGPGWRSFFLTNDDARLIRDPIYVSSF